MPDLPETYFMSVALAAILLVDSAFNLRTSWGIPYLTVVITIFLWYLIEPLYLPEGFLHFSQETVETAYGGVLIALLSFALSTRTFVDLMRPKNANRILSKAYVPSERVLIIVVCLWLILLAYGIVRMQGDVFAALFPLSGRHGANMWSRAAGVSAGGEGFIVSAAGYLYVLCLASFGILYFLISKRLYAVLAIILIAISWPYAALQGSRNTLLAVALPALGSYLLVSRHGLLRKGLVFSGSVLAMELLLRIMIYYRNVGFENVNLSEIDSAKHVGLNMASELVYCVQYIKDGTLELSFGQRYLAELANFIPRAIWPEKPLLSIDYAVARGFGGGNSDIGVFATVSTGVIGGGVLNFGPVFGPVWVGLLMSSWVGLLSRFRLQGTPLRFALLLVGLGLTFNLGRDITLLVLWPLVFGYIGVRLIEWRASAIHPHHQALRPLRQSTEGLRNKWARS
jgi:oligosaccharide repeat unit polymerase